MPRQNDVRFTFEPASGAAFEVIEFKLEEGLSRPFNLSLELASIDAELDFGTLLDKPALLTIWQGETPVRYVHGLISSLSQGDTGFRRTRYSAVVEPALARTRLCSNWRIFQQQSVPQILDAVLKAHRLHDVVQHLSYDHQPREYCVQAGETDLDFMARLAAEEGLLYTFEHRTDGHRLIITDRVSAIGTITPNETVDPEEACNVLYQAKGGGDQPEPALHSFRYTEQVRTARQVQRDYTFTHPRYDQEHIATGTQLEHQGRDYERFDYPGRYKRDVAGKPFTKTRLNALRSDARIAEVEGDDARLQPGKSFDLIDHPRDDMNIRWRTVSIEHTGTQHCSQQEEAADSASGTRYHYTATLAPAAFDWKAPLCPKPRIDGPQTATVVGPPNEEIFCDEWGRVKVSFPWDRASQNNEHSSCWIRVAQGWAGTTWGAMAIPRIGQELIIQYFDGDPDQPIAMGRAYREANLPPYELPKHKTRMTIKSQTHKGDGFNELRFEDEKGVEEIYVHAEKDQNIHVNHNETTFVGNDRSERVDHNETISIGDHRTEDVGKNETISIGANRSVTIGANKTETIALAKAETIGLGKALTIGAAYQTSVGAAMNTSVGLSQSEQVGLNKAECVGNRYSIEVEDEFVVRVGKSILVMKADGTIVLNGHTFDFSASGPVNISGAEVDLNIKLVEHDSAVLIKKPPLELHYTYADLKPEVGAPYRVEFDDGTITTGTLDDQGFARIDNPPGEGGGYFGYDTRDPFPLVDKAKNSLAGCVPSTPEQAELAIARYRQQETEHGKDHYFADEIAVSGAWGVGYDDMIDSYAYADDPVSDEAAPATPGEHEQVPLSEGSRAQS